MTFSTDGKERRLELPEGALVQSELDEVRRLVNLKMNGEEVVQQSWYANGSLKSLSNGNTVMQPEYNKYGEPTRIINRIIEFQKR
ncbi:MAG TPA: hypothetical protein VK957_13860 [Lunatimonas sp.]|nr:hypothetical protein [Lunatimonas sp.]